MPQSQPPAARPERPAPRPGATAVGAGREGPWPPRDWTSVASLLALAFAGVCLLFGVLAGDDPQLAIGGALAIGFLVIAMGDLTAGLVIFALIAFFAITPGAVGSLISAQAASLVLAFSWLARVATQAIPTRLFWSRHPLITGSRWRSSPGSR